MTAEKQTPEALAAECKRLAGWTKARAPELHAAIDRLAALASAQAQQEPFWFAVISRRAPVINKAIRSEDVANEYADKQRELWPDVEVVPLYRSAPPAPAVEKREPLTDRQIIAAIEAHGLNLAWRCYEHDIDCARAIERAHGIGISPADAKENGNG